MIKNIIIIIIFLIILILILSEINKYDVTYIKSKTDNKYYLVRNLNDKQPATELLAQIKSNMTKIINYIIKNGKKSNLYPYFEKMKDVTINITINESSDDTLYTSYTINKGEEIIFCLRSKKTKKLHDINLLMYVALHEYAHVICPEYGHTTLYKQIFSYMTQCALTLGLYKYINFANEHKEYCGTMITASIV